MFTKTAKLLNVQVTDFEGKTYYKLVFLGEKYDRGLDKMVECSDFVSIQNDHISELSNFRDHIGEVISVPVVLNTFKDSNIINAKTADGTFVKH